MLFSTLVYLLNAGSYHCLHPNYTQGADDRRQGKPGHGEGRGSRELWNILEIM